MDTYDQLKSIFGPLEKLSHYDDGNRLIWKHFRADDLRIITVEDVGATLVCVDLESAFNKEQHCPIFFTLPVLGEKKERILAAVQFLRENWQIAGNYLSELPGFEDLDYRVRGEFYMGI